MGLIQEMLCSYRLAVATKCEATSSTAHCSSSLSCMAEYLATHSGGILNALFSRSNWDTA